MGADTPVQTEEDVDLESLVYLDELTSLHNRRYLRENYDILCAAARQADGSLSVLFIDVDHFKSVNDRFGHDNGDRVLKMVADAIVQSTPPNGITIRWAGDEFLVLLPGVGKTLAVAAAIKLLERVRVEPWKAPSGEFLRQTLSIGVASYPSDTDNPYDLRELADDAALASKRKGRNAVSTVDARRPDNLDPNQLFRYFPCRRFVARSGLFNQCKAAVTTAPHLVRPCLVFKGPRGIGRSRFLEELQREIDLQRTHTLAVRCQPHLTAQPFGELAESLMALLEANPERIEALARLDSTSLAALSPFIPALVRFGLVNPGPVPTLPAPRLIEAMGKLLKALASDRPTIIIMDDFQWCNHGTRLALQSARAGNQQDLAVFAGLVQDESQPSPTDEDLRRWLADSEQAGWLDRRTLTEFSAEQVRDMVDSILPGLAAHRELCDLVHRLSHGRPMLVEGLIKLLIHRQKVRLHEGQLEVDLPNEDDLPSHLEDYFVPRVVDLDPVVSRVLSKAAVLGNEFELKILSVLAGMSEAELLGILELARQQSLISGDDAGGRFAFQEKTVRQVLYEGLPDEERRELHGTAARIIEAQTGRNQEAVMSELAFHYAAAGNVEKSQQQLSKLSDEYRGLISQPAVEMYVGKLPPRKSWGTETTLLGPQLELALRIARRFRVCLQNMTNFPSTSEMVKGALDALHRELLGVLQLTEVLSLVEADGRLMINGEVPNQRDSEMANGPELVSLLSSAELRGISIQRGIEKDELLHFLDMILMRPAERDVRGGWDALLREHHITHLLTNERVYVAIGEKDLDLARRGPTIIHEEAPREKSAMPEISADVLEALKAAVAELQSAGDSDRTRLMEQIGQLLTRLGPAMPIPVQPVLAPPKRTDAVLGAKLLQLSNLVDLEGFSRIGQAVDVLLEELGSADETAAQAVAVALAAKGQEAIEPLLRTVRTAETLRLRRRAYHLLRKLDPTINRRLLDDMVVGERPEEARRTLEVLLDLASMDLGEWLPFLVRHPDPGTRHGVLTLLAQRPAEKSMAMIVHALDIARGDALTDCINALGQARWVPAVTPLCRMVHKRLAFVPERIPMEAQRAACRALGLIGDPTAVPALLEVARWTPPWFFTRNKTLEVRDTAVFALSCFPTSLTGEILKNLAGDRHLAAVVRQAQTRQAGVTAPETPGSAPFLGPPVGDKPVDAIPRQ